MFSPLIKNIVLQVPLSQVLYHLTGMSFKWQEVRLLIPYEQSPIEIDVDWKLMEEFKGAFQDEIIIYLQCHRIKQYIKVTKVIIHPQDGQNFEKVVNRIKKIVDEITTISRRESIRPDKVRTIVQEHGIKCDQNKARRILSVILDPSQKRQIVHTIPLAQVYYRPGGVEFKWNDARLSIPYNEFPVRLPLPPALVEEFKSEFKGDMNVTLVFEWLSAYIEVKEIKIGNQVLQGINDVISRMTRLVGRIQSEAKQKSLNLAASGRLFLKEGFNYSDEKLHRILAVIFDPSQRRQIVHTIPLAQLDYHPGGVNFKWNDVRFSIPHKEFPVKLPLAALVEEFKNEFKEDMNVALVFEWLSPYIELKEIRIEDQVLQGINDVISRITALVERIQSEAKKQSLNLATSRSLFLKEGFDYDDKKIHKILSMVINQMPVHPDSKEVPVLLSQLEYHAEGIRFPHAGVQLAVTKDKLPFEVGPALDDEKGHFEGEMIFQVETGFMCAWEPGKEKIAIGYLGQDVNQCTIKPATLGEFKNLRGEIVCAAIKNLNKTVITIDQVEKILQGWGLDRKHQEIANRIIETIPCWTRTKDFCVPLKDVDYYDDKIMITSDGVNLPIRKLKLPFETDHLLENIKDVFEGDIRIVIDQPYRFAWDQGKGELIIEERNAVTVTVHIDEDTLAQFEKIRFLYINLLDKVDSGVAERLIRDGLSPADNILDSPIIPKDYPRECLGLLQEIAAKIFVTEEDFWFHIDKCLVWERPIPGAATYIFKWPEERLELFIAGIWISELQDIRENEAENGFITRVMHTDVVNWKRNLKRKIRENCC